MSNLSSLSREYWAGSQLSSELNRNLFVLRKASWKLSGPVAVRPSEIEESRSRVLRIVRGVRAMREHSLPGASFARLGEAVEGHAAEPLAAGSRAASTEGWAEALDRLTDRLDEGADLSTADFRLLDNISVSLADECARVYTELSRR